MTDTDEVEEAEPGEIVLGEPGSEAIVVQAEEKENRDSPDRPSRQAIWGWLGFRSWQHFQLVSMDTAVAMTPSSRRSDALGGSALSSEKSMVTVSPVRTEAGTSAVKVWLPGSTYFSVLRFVVPIAAVRLWE